VTIHQFGDRAVLIELSGVDSPIDLVSRLAMVLPPNLQSRAGISSVLVESQSPDPDLTALVSQALAAAHAIDSTVTSSPHAHTLKVTYDGLDLNTLAAQLNMSVEALVAAHTSTAWTVALVGFAPGLPYLVPVSDNVFADIPRLDTPRVKVPAGSVAVAAGMSCVYPKDMPGGWNIIGRTETVLFDPTLEDPSLLHPGDTVTFEVAQ
jgi:KipI family sensor histidine kinase inhibitor